VFAAAQIYNMLKEYAGNVTVRIDSLAASAASVIAMAGNTVEMSPVAMMMIHNPSTIAFGEAKDMQKAIGMLAEVKESILNAYEAKTGLNRVKLSHMMDDESWFNAKKAVELGFADKILFSAVDKETVMKVEEETKEPEKRKEDDEEKKKTNLPFQQDSVLFSRKSVENSFISKVSDEEVKEKVTINQLRQRLNLIIH
jgi:ATP-dependent Clp protease protease subunit